MTPSLASTKFWSGKSVLVTGHTGFKGFWLSLWLKRLGANVSGISLPPNTDPSLYDLCNFEGFDQSINCDIRNFETLSSHLHSINPEIIFHLAAQPLVRESYKAPLDTFSSNMMGTANVLESMRGLSRLESAVLITTDKVYRETGSQDSFDEDDALGGYDPYSASKAACEIVIDSYRKSFFYDAGIPIASARAGNVIGGGDWSDDRLIPDAIRAWQDDKELNIRNPMATRPWQHVLEPLNGYLILAQEIAKFPNKAQAYNFGPQSDSTASVKDVIEIAKKCFGSGKVHYTSNHNGPHEAEWLSLNIEKSERDLGFMPRWDIQETVFHSISWYVKYFAGENPLQLCNQQIDLFESSI